MRERIAAYYVTSPDRIGLAIAAGGVLAGFVAMLLVAMGGQRDPLALLLALVLGAVFAMLGIVAMAGPVWLALHLAGRRGPGVAAMTGAGVAMLLSVFAQTQGFAAPGDTGSNYRWTSAIATGLMVAILAAGIGWAMQRVAYRRLM